MNRPTNHNTFFRVEADEFTDQALGIIPTKYLEELNPHHAIGEMREYVEPLEHALQQYRHESMREPINVAKRGSLAFELVRTFLASFTHVF